MKYLIHMGDEPIYDKVNDLPPFEFLPGKATPVNDDFIASRILEHKRLEGLVEVPMEIDEEGFPHPKVAEAKKIAIEALRSSEDELVSRYVSTQRDYRIRENKAPLPPSPAIAKIIAKRRIDLAAMGINISGAGFSLPVLHDDTAELARLRKEVEQLKNAFGRGVQGPKEDKK